MTVTVNNAHLPPLGSHQREEVGRQLQATLVELVDLSPAGQATALDRRRTIASETPVHAVERSALEDQRPSGGKG